MKKIEIKHIGALAKSAQKRACSMRTKYLTPQADPDMLLLAEYAYLDIEKRTNELLAMPNKALTQEQTENLLRDLLRKLMHFSSIAAQVQCLLEFTEEAKTYFSASKVKNSK